MKPPSISKTALLLLLLSLCCFASGFAKQLEFQNLVLKPLSKPPSHNPEDLKWTTTESQTQTLDSTSLTVQLEHIDTLSSVNETPETLFNLRLKRDTSRVKTLISLATSGGGTGVPAKGNTNTNASRSGRQQGKDFSSSIISGLSQGSGEYFTRLGVGTPPRYSYMVLDTGSDIVWLQCAPCRKCYSQTDPIFDPKRSTTFVKVPCGSPLCRRVDSSGCNQNKACLYQVSYGDGSFTFGEFSTETLTFRGTRVKNVALGCGHDNEGLFVGAAGLLGLGRGRLSFPTQTGRRFGRKFSYCLVDRSGSASAKPSSVLFGESAVPKSAVFTPMLKNPKLDTFYYLELVGMSVGGVRVPGINSALFRLDTAGNGGVIIDSGTSVTRLNRPAYVALRDAFKAGATGLKPAPEFSLFDTCFDLSGKKEVKVPTVVMHFSGGADVSLPAANYLIPVTGNGVFCFAFAGTTSGLSIIGNIQQQGFRVVFDSAGSRIGFAPRGCL